MRVRGGCQRGREKVINISSNSSLNKIAGATSHTGRRAVIKQKKRCREIFLLSPFQSKLNSYIGLNSRCCLFSHKQLHFLHVHYFPYLLLHSVISIALSRSLPVPLCPFSSFHNIRTLTISVFHFLLPLFWPLCLFFSFRSYPLVIPRIWLNPLRFLPRARRDATQLSLLMNPVTHIRMLSSISSEDGYKFLFPKHQQTQFYHWRVTFAVCLNQISSFLVKQQEEENSEYLCTLNLHYDW